MKRVLLTAFEPFAGQARNASQEIGAAVANHPPDGVELDRLVLPVVAGACLEIAWPRIESFVPDVVLALGQDDSAARLHVERLALNVNDFRIADNAGNTPRDEVITPEGPAAYFTTLPTRRIVETLNGHGIAAALSYSAGTFVCNHLLYGLLHRGARCGWPGRIGFIHVPLIPDQPGWCTRPAGAPTWEQMVEGIRLSITTSLV